MKKDYIEYNGKKYDAYHINISDIFEDDYSNSDVIVSVLSLNDALSKGLLNKEKEANEVDDSIFYYVDDDFMNSNPTYEELVEHVTNCIFPIIEC